VTVQILRLQAALGQANRSLEHRVRERTLELQRAIQRLTELNQLKANFIANISHELRTPLTQIKGYLDVLVSGGLGELSADQLEAVAIVQRANQRLERLIEDLIQFAVAARGELLLNLAVMNVRPVLQAAADQAALKAQANGIRLVVAAAGNLPPVRADEEKLGWVIQQLVDNALKFTPRGGQVRLEAAATPGLMTLTVSDTGIGIPAERLEEIFEPFHQLDGSMTRKYSGTGLGLALVKRIIEAHGSTVKVASRPGEGSRFEFSLAVAGQPVGASREAVS
jgi:signal transduction histidine kinase